MRNYLLIVFATLYIRFVGLTSRIRYIGEEDLPSKPFVYIFWHNRILLMAYTHKGRAVRVLVSTSKDGDVSAGVNKQFGHRIMRGTASTASEGRRSLIKMIRCLKEKNSVALTPDGPRGPALKVKKGVPFISQKIGVPLVPVVNAVKKKIVLSSWDKCIFPLPFNKVVVVSGKPIYIKPEEDLDAAAVRIENALNEVTAQAERTVENM